MDDQNWVRAKQHALEEMEATLDSVAIARLVEEVRGTDFEVIRAYNRTYNRHNR